MQENKMKLIYISKNFPTFLSSQESLYFYFFKASYEGGCNSVITFVN